MYTTIVHFLTPPYPDPDPDHLLISCLIALVSTIIDYMKYLYDEISSGVWSFPITAFHFLFRIILKSMVACFSLACFSSTIAPNTPTYFSWRVKHDTKRYINVFKMPKGTYETNNLHPCELYRMLSKVKKN